MARRGCPCGICDNVNLPSACPTCINSRLMDKYKLLQKLSRRRDNLRMQVEARLKGKHEVDQQHHWRIVHQDLISQFKENLHQLENQLQKRRDELSEKKRSFSAQANQLALASKQLTKHRDKLGLHQPELTRSLDSHLTSLTSELHQRRRHVFRQLCKMFPLKCTSTSVTGCRDNSSSSVRWMVCGVHLPASDDPHSVSELELGASSGYLLQLLHLVSRYLCAPVLHTARIKGSTSKIWERSSYWDARPSKSGEYPLYITAYPLYTTSHGSALQEDQDGGTSSMMGFSTIEGTGGRLRGGGHDANSIVGTSSMRKEEMHIEVQKAIKLLKRSVNCVFSYGFNEMLSSVPSNLTTFQGLVELMILLSSREVKLRMGRGPQHQIDTLADSAMSAGSSMDLYRLGKDRRDFKVSIRGNSNINSFYFVGKDIDFMDGKVGDSVLEEWDMVEHIPLPPPPSHSEDIEHWTRAMFLDAKK